PVIIQNVQTAAIDRAPKEITAIYCVAQVLQHSQFRLHEDFVVAIILVAHDAVFELDVAHIVVIYSRVVTNLVAHFDRNARKASVEYLGNVAPHQQALVAPYVKWGSVGLVITASAPDGLAWAGRVAIVIYHQGAPAGQNSAKPGRKCSGRVFGPAGGAQAVREFVDGCGK